MTDGPHRNGFQSGTPVAFRASTGAVYPWPARFSRLLTGSLFRSLPSAAFLARLSFLCICVILPGATARLHAQQPPAPAQSLALAGNDRVLWIVFEKWDSEEASFLNWITWMDPSTLALRRLAMPPQLGQIHSLAAWEDSLHLFVSIESEEVVTTGHYACARPAEQRRERRLPQDALPLALTGGSAELPGLWALVDGKTAEAVRVEWEEHLRSLETRPATGPAAPSEDRSARELSLRAPSPEEPGASFSLVVYDGVRWRPGFEAPPGSGDMARAWLTISGERCHLFWQNSPGDETVQYASREGGSWAAGPPLRLSTPLDQGAAGLLNKQLVFAALLEDESRAGLRCEPRILLPDAQDWNERPPLLEEDGRKVLLLPRGSMVAGFGDKLALLRPEEPEPRVGLWSPTDGRVLLPFTAVPLPRAHSGDSRQSIEELAYLMAVIGIVLLVYWRHRESISSPVQLPPGMVAADFGRRGLAMLIDMAPAALIVGLIWHHDLLEFSAARAEAIRTQQMDGPDWWTLGWAWATFAFVYAGWCTVFELFLSATPGKRLLGCRVVSESGEPPLTLQIVLRNALRLVELFPPLRIWPFVLVVVMTRNRQRVGDLLARTIVVEQVRQ